MFLRPVCAKHGPFILTPPSASPPLTSPCRQEAPGVGRTALSVSAGLDPAEGGDVHGPAQGEPGLYVGVPTGTAPPGRQSTNQESRSHCKHSQVLAASFSKVLCILSPLYCLSCHAFFLPEQPHTSL